MKLTAKVKLWIFVGVAVFGTGYFIWAILFAPRIAGVTAHLVAP